MVHVYSLCFILELFCSDDRFVYFDIILRMETVFYLVSSKLQAYKFSLDKLKENGIIEDDRT